METSHSPGSASSALFPTRNPPLALVVHRFSSQTSVLVIFSPKKLNLN